MSRSLNEVAGLALKAARGAGFPLGHAEDFARAVVVLAATRPAALPEVSRALQATRSPAKCTQEGAVLTVDGTSIIMAAPVALDALATDCHTVRLSGVDAPDLLWAYLQVAARDQSVFAGFSGDDPVTLSRCENVDVPDISGPVEIPDDVWAVWDALAQKTYVPATAASRLAGAGAGLTDND